MALAVGAFTTLNEADTAAKSLLDIGFHVAAVRAVSRTGGGRMRLAGQVPVMGIGEPAKLVNQTERVGLTALVAGLLGLLLAGVALFVLPRMGLDVLAPLRVYLSGWQLTAAVLLGPALVLSGAGALIRRREGLPHDLAFRYSLRLDQGDTIIGVTATSAAEARSAQETLALHGAILAHVTHGTLEPEVSISTPVRLATSEN